MLVNVLANCFVKGFGFEKGAVASTYSEDLGARYMKRDELIIDVDLNMGESNAIFWTCDFSGEYVSINADYRS